MKGIAVFLLGFLLMPLAIEAQKPVRYENNDAYTYGEKITYKVKYNLYFNINVGEVVFEVAPKAKEIAGNKVYHLKGTGRTYGFYDPFYKIRDTYESYVDVKSLLPIVFIRDVNEGSFSFNEYVIFNHNNSTAKSKKRTQKVPQFTQDVLSAIYYARTLDYDNAKVGDKFMMHAFIDDSAYHCGVKYMGKEVIKTDKGKFRCIKLQPLLVADRMFKSEDDMIMWVTDDKNRVPVRIESGISVGKIRADLDNYENLKNPILSKL